jgi:hypothetical protein
MVANTPKRPVCDREYVPADAFQYRYAVPLASYRFCQTILNFKHSPFSLRKPNVDVTIFISGFGRQLQK